MIKLNKIALGVIALSCASASFAASMAPMPAADVMQYGVSAMYDRDTASMAVGFNIQNANMEAGVGTSIEIAQLAAGQKYGTYDLTGYLGKRMEMKSNFYGAVGLGGMYTFLSGNYQASGITTNEYVAGAYVGLEYQPTSNVQMFVRIMPFAYERTSTNGKAWEVFHDGQIGMKYFW